MLCTEINIPTWTHKQKCQHIFKIYIDTHVQKKKKKTIMN